ncbi:MAG: hypothetical protein KatS3mg125_0349 [Lysobacterales bacterium]|jgi:hypothetical protein|nr:MAG: hypothetical protein KatS3mg125_0349 [Xanthomonadales bacterium]
MKPEERPEEAPGSLGGALRFFAFLLVAILIVLGGLLVTGVLDFGAAGKAFGQGAALVGLLAAAAILISLIMRVGRR